MNGRIGGAAPKARQASAYRADPGLLRSHWCVIVYDLQLYLYLWISSTTPSARPPRR